MNKDTHTSGKPLSQQANGDIAGGGSSGTNPVSDTQVVPSPNPHHDRQNKLSARKTQRHILLVDDEKHLLETIEFILEAANYKVSIATDGQKALNRVLEFREQKVPLDLIITDIRMPRLSGIELILRLKKQGIQIPVLVITNHNSRELRKQLNNLGCYCCLSKPINDDELLACIDKMLKNR